MCFDEQDNVAKIPKKVLRLENILKNVVMQIIMKLRENKSIPKMAEFLNKIRGKTI